MKKLFSAALTLALLASLLSGCMCEVADTTLAPDGSGTMRAQFGFSAALVDALDLRDKMAQSGFTYFLYNGHGYYGDEAEQAFSSPEEFNALFAEVRDETEEVSAAASIGVVELASASDGGLTLTIRNTQSQRALAISSALRDELPEYSEQELASLLDGMVMLLRFTFPTELLSYSTGSGITVDGSTVTVDCLSLPEGTFRFSTSLVAQKPLGSVTPENIPASGTAHVRRQSIEIDGKPVTFQTYALLDSAGGETNYVRLRDIAFALNGTAAQFGVSWNGSVVIDPLRAYEPNGSELQTPFSGDRRYAVSSAATVIYGETIPFTAITLTDDAGGGYTYYKLRDLGKVLDFNVSWSASRGIYIESSVPYAA